MSKTYFKLDETNLLEQGEVMNSEIISGSVVVHRKEPSVLGKVLSVDDNKLTALVQWEDSEIPDVQWVSNLENHVHPSVV